MSTRTLFAALAIQLILGGAFVFAASSGFDFLEDEVVRARPARVPAATKHRFDANRAYALVKEQVALGPRPAGSAASRRNAARMRARLPNGRYEAVPRGLRNVVGRIPGRLPAIVIGAHYDTEATVPNHVGANDGAAGTAAVVEIARALRKLTRRKGAPEIRFALFDGEEEPKGSTNFERDALRGSKAYVRAHRRTTRMLLLLDYIGGERLLLPREGNSTVELWDQVRAEARRVGVGRVFPDATRFSFIDDHTPFLAAGIPAVDFIDGDYPHADTAEDTADKVYPRSLDAVGETVVEMVRSLR